MKPKDFLEEDYPILQDIFRFAKEHTALFLGMWAALATAVMFALNSLEYIYQLGYYHYGLNVPQVYLGAIHTSNIPFSVVCGVVGFVILSLYSYAAWNAYIEYRFGKFILKVVAAITVFFLLIIGTPLIKEIILEKMIPDFWETVYFCVNVLFLVVVTLAGLNCLTIGTLLSASDTDKLERIKNGIIWIDKEKQKVNTKVCKKIRLCHLKKTEKKLNEKQQKLEEQMQDNSVHVAKEKPKKKHTILRIAAYSLIVTYTLTFGVLPFVGISEAMMNDEFEIIYTDNISFTDQNQEKLDNPDINGLVKLYQYEDKVIASPCTYTDDKITIYSAVQHVIPVENITFVHMRFQNHRIR